MGLLGGMLKNKLFKHMQDSFSGNEQQQRNIGLFPNNGQAFGGNMLKNDLFANMQQPPQQQTQQQQFGLRQQNIGQPNMQQGYNQPQFGLMDYWNQRRF